MNSSADRELPPPAGRGESQPTLACQRPLYGSLQSENQEYDRRPPRFLLYSGRRLEGESTFPHPFPYLLVISVQTLILTVLAFYALHLRDELERLRRIHSSTMTILAVAARTASLKRLKDSFRRRLQWQGAAEGSAAGTELPAPPSLDDIEVAEAPCPLEAEGLPREMCPLMQVVTQADR